MKPSTLVSGFMGYLLRALFIAALLQLTPAAYAGRTCEPKALSTNTLNRGMALAERVNAQLNASGAQVVVIARVGQDLSKYGLRFSHLGFAYKTADASGASRWLVAHKLNDCGTANSAIYRQGLGEFFLDDMFLYEAGWVVPTAEAQSALLATLTGPDLTRMHTSAYSMLAYPWSTRYQQSNQWALETLGGALQATVRSRSDAQQWLQANGYTPTVLRLGAMTRLGARATQANIAFDDHPNEKRFGDHIETVSVDSVFSFMQRSRLAGAMVLVR
jgi:hypothetical protein